MSDQSAYEQYQHRTELTIKSTLAELEVQPILFIGSGVSRRYFGAPDWHGALRESLVGVDDGGPEYDYYNQLHEGDTIKTGTIIAERMHKWAWSKGKEHFPPDLFKSNVSPDAFIKFKIANNLISITPKLDQISALNLFGEIGLLQSIRPHAIITTNFDTFVESLFEGYEPIIGQSVIRYNMNSFGEIFKIHGCATQPASMVLTQNDYSEFTRKKKYISSKLVTYLAEHPVFIFGYSFSDPNVQAILEDIGEIITNDDGLIPNIFFVKWEEDAAKRTSLPEEHVIIAGGNQYRVRAIVTHQFDWIYKTLAHNQGLSSINPKLVRALAARAYKLVRTDIPRGTVEVNYQVLESVSSNADVLPNLLGITQADNPNLTHPLILSQVGKLLGYDNFNGADKLLKKVKKDKGIDIRATDNQYHCRVKTGEKATSFTRKFSTSTVELLKRVRDGLEYDV